MSSLKPRFFITGGTGFVGRRLVDILRGELGAEVTVLAHRTSPGALMLSAKGVTFDFTPITDAVGLARAIQGHDAVFHLAYGRYGSAADMQTTTVNGTRAMVNAALASGVRRFINVSTAAVYFGAPDGIIDESVPRRKWGWSYSDEKLAAEDLVRNATTERGLEGSVFEVAGVYGPGGETFVVNPLKNMRRGIIVLPNYGEGIANMTYIDDVVQALVLGLKDAAVGETFIVKGPGTITRMDAHRALEAMLGYEAVRGMATEEVVQRLKGGSSISALARVVPAAARAVINDIGFRDAVRNTPVAPVAGRLYRWLRSAAPKAAAPEPLVAPSVNAGAADRPLILPQKIMIDYLSARIEFTSQKASRLLGYKPVVEFEEGMSRTREWAQWAGLLGPAG